MADNPSQPTSNLGHEIPSKLGTQNQGIMDKTLGEVLKTNPQAQGMIMQSMHLSPEKFQQMLSMTGNNALMNTKIRDLFSSGVVQQAMAQQGQNAQQVQQGVPVQVQLTPEQLAQMQSQSGDGVIVQPMPQKTSFLDKVKSWFK